MSTNEKNTLQTYCQRNGIALPDYMSIQDVRTGKWISTVTFIYDGKNVKYDGKACSRKTQADIAAASVAVLDICDPNLGSVADVNISSVKRAHTSIDFCNSVTETGMYVLIDYENVNKLQHLHNTFSKPGDNDAKIFKFLGYSHHKAETDEASHIVHSGGSDAVDHAISVFVGILIAKHKISSKMSIVILTKDLFAERVHNMLSNSCGGPEVKHIPSERQCVEFLHTRGYEQTNKRIVYED
jgi:hypothetical protein